MGVGSLIIVHVYMGAWNRQAKNLEENAPPPHPRPPHQPYRTPARKSKKYETIGAKHY